MSTVPTMTAGSGRVDAPRPVVGEPTAQHTQPDRALGRKRRSCVECARKRRQRGDSLDPPPNDLRRLVDDGAAVDDVDDAPGQRGIREPRQQREQHAERFPESGGDVHRVEVLSVNQRRVEVLLPRIGVMADDCAEMRDVREFAPGSVANGVLRASWIRGDRESRRRHAPVPRDGWKPNAKRATIRLQCGSPWVTDASVASNRSVERLGW